MVESTGYKHNNMYAVLIWYPRPLSLFTYVTADHRPTVYALVAGYFIKCCNIGIFHFLLFNKSQAQHAHTPTIYSGYTIGPLEPFKHALQLQRIDVCRYPVCSTRYLIVGYSLFAGPDRTAAKYLKQLTVY